jgi:hypothetical protein
MNLYSLDFDVGIRLTSHLCTIAMNQMIIAQFQYLKPSVKHQYHACHVAMLVDIELRKMPN